MRELKKIVVIGPVYPFKGGISHYTGLLIRNLRKKYKVEAVSYSMQYPKLLFRKEQRDFSNRTFEVKDAEYLINTANPFNILDSAKKINQMEPDLVILDWWHPYFAPCYQILLSKLNCIKAFICHNVLPHERFPFDEALTKATLKKANFCIVHSEDDMINLNRLLPYMPVKKNMHPTYNAFCLKNLTRDEARKKLKLKDEKMLLFFGLVRKYKGLMYLINAMPMIIEKVDNVKLYIVGDFGKDKQEYFYRIKQLEIEDHIFIRDGYVPDEEVEPFFAAADLNVCPYESATQSGILQISFGFGLPAVVTDVGGLPEVVTNEKTGYVVESKSPQAIADAVIDYFNANREENMRANVVKEADRFSWDRMTETIEDLWSQL